MICINPSPHRSKQSSSQQPRRAVLHVGLHFFHPTYNPTSKTTSSIIWTFPFWLTSPPNFISHFNQCIRCSAGVRMLVVSPIFAITEGPSLGSNPTFSSPISRPEDDDGPLRMHYLVPFLRWKASSLIFFAQKARPTQRDSHQLVSCNINCLQLHPAPHMIQPNALQSRDVHTLFNTTPISTYSAK